MDFISNLSVPKLKRMIEELKKDKDNDFEKIIVLLEKRIEDAEQVTVKG